MKKFTLSFLVLCSIMIFKNLSAQLPKFDHVVIVMEENYAYKEIIGSGYAPTLTWLSKQPYTANFSQAYAITHPSEPNYLVLFSGSTQGAAGDYNGPIPGAPLNDCNVGASFIAAGYTFIGYAEDLPGDGWISYDVGNYATRHCPWINWQNGSKDVVPDSSDLEYAFFPDSNNYSSLPTMAWVIPDIYDDMHSPSNPSVAIPAGDTWFHNNIMPLIRWAVNHNTLVITTWDEDDDGDTNNIPSLWCGANIVGGTYSSPKFNHYDVLRTIEDMYSLPLCDSSADGKDITGIWKSAGIASISQQIGNLEIWPNPANGKININVNALEQSDGVLIISDVTGRVIKENSIRLNSGENRFTVDAGDVSSGIYLLDIKAPGVNLCKKIVVQN